MRSPWRWLKRRWELRSQEPRRVEIESQLRRELGQEIKLVPASVKGGYDEIYQAQLQGVSLAVVRVNSPFKVIRDPIGPQDPGVPLGPLERLDREWSAYTALAPLRLSPVPIWRCEDAIACSWVAGGRASDQLRNYPDRIWAVLDRAIPAISQMHSAGVVHLDLNLGNILLDDCTSNVTLIDFEFGPVAWVTLAQQRGFDYLRLIDDCLKPRRGGALLGAELSRLVCLLNDQVDQDARHADMTFALAKLQRLAGAPRVLIALRSIFPSLDSTGLRSAS